MNHTSIRSLAALALCAALAACGQTPQAAQSPTNLPAEPSVADVPGGLAALNVPGGDFVQRQGSGLTLHGQPFRFGGSNNYYLSYNPSAMADAVLQTAAKQHFTVMRTWGFLDANPSSTGSDGPKNGVYFQSYAGGLLPDVNEGANGLQRLDYVIYQASKLGIKLVIPFTNNWNDFGGMDQYVKWRGLTHHDDFYTDPLIRLWFKWYIFRLLNHKNVYSGLTYREDPTIMTWELANEPRCKGTLPASAHCTTATLTRWTAEMSGFVKLFDRRHLVSLGDEGFLADQPGGSDWTRTGGEGVDGAAIAALPTIDVVSAHLYPDGWNKSADWGTAWIADHLALARRSHKAFVLGEFGLQDKAARDGVYRTWTDAVQQGGGAGDLFWMLPDRDDQGGYYPDYDGFSVYCPGSTCTVLSQHAQRMQGLTPAPAPTAADDAASVNAGASVTLDVLANDHAGTGALDPASLDLDPTAPGQQTTKAVREGTFSVTPGGQVVFTSNGLSGSASAAYTVQDASGQTSNRTALTVAVQGGSSSVPLSLYTFEDGVQGWAPGSWQTGVGSVSQSSAFHSEGASSLQVSGTNGGWFGVESASALDLSGHSHLSLDLAAPNAGTSYAVAIKSGPAYTWCQSGFSYANAGVTVHLSLDLNADFGCAVNLAEVHAIYVYLQNGDFYLDNVRAE